MLTKTKTQNTNFFSTFILLFLNFKVLNIVLKTALNVKKTFYEKRGEKRSSVSCHQC